MLNSSLTSRVVLGVLGLAVPVCALLTGWVRAHALRVGLIDHPNSRSSHAAAVPRGGGLAIVGTVGMGLAVLALLGSIGIRDALGIFIPASAVAAVGYVDDHRSLTARARLLVHVLAAALAIWSTGSVVTTEIGGVTIQAGVGLAVFLLVAVVWFTNLYNFMDGIDGIAAGNAVFIGGAIAFLAGTREGSETAMIPLLVAAASAGFLLLNWPPARIFLGDVGSGFLGFTLACCGLQALRTGAVSSAVLLILVSPFLVDATVTLLTRLLSGASGAEPHRRHVYQRLARRWGGHLPVTLAYLLVDLVVLLPTALWCQGDGARERVALLAVYGGLVTLAVLLGAGRSGHGEK